VPSYRSFHRFNMYFTMSCCPLLAPALVDSGPLWIILSFLDAKDLSSAESTCRTLRWLGRSTSKTAWQLVEERQIDDISECGSSKGQRSDASTARHRVIRQYKATEYCKRMERLARDHYDYGDPMRSHVNCRGCRCGFPSSLDYGAAFRRPHLHEFFFRFSYRIPPRTHRQPPRSGEATRRITDRRVHGNFDEGDDSLLIWQGFLPFGGRDTSNRNNNLFFDMTDVYKTLQWQSMRDFLDLFDSSQGGNGGATGFFASINHPDVLELLYEAIDNLTVTVVAIERRMPDFKTSLVVATGGFHDRGVVDIPIDAAQHLRRRQTYLLQPRNVNSHGIRMDEDWIQVALSTTTTTTTTAVAETSTDRSASGVDMHTRRENGGGQLLHGLSLSHEW